MSDTAPLPTPPENPGWLTGLRARRGAGFLALLTATLLLGVLLARIDAGLRNRVAPSGILSFEKAGSAERAQAILASWAPEQNQGEDRIPWARASLLLDVPFLLLYPATLAFACLWLSRRATHGRVGPRLALVLRLGRVVAVLQPLAGVADLVENAALWSQIGSIAGSIAGSGAGDRAARVALWAAELKFALVYLALGYLLLGVAILVLARQRDEPVIQYLYYCRFPLLTALSLVLLGPLAVGPASSLLGSVFDLQGFGPGVVAGLALLAVWTTLLTLRMILRYGKARFGEAPPRGVLEWLEHHRPYLAGYLTAPLLLTAAFASSHAPAGASVWRRIAPGSLGFYASVAGGLALGLSFLALARMAQKRAGLGDGAEALFHLPGELPPPAPGSPEASARFALPDPDPEPPPLLRPFPMLHQGYFDPDTHRLLPGHLNGLLLLGLTLIVYAVCYWPLRPDVAWLSFPALAYLMWIFIAIGWSLPAASFFFDRLRIPTLLALVAAVALMQVYFRADHYYAASRVEGEALSPLVALDQRDAELEAGTRPLIAVATSGGGIRAALWTARVLAGLHEGDADGAAPWRGVRLISGVSGGSVGAMLYVDALSEQGLDTEALLKAAAANGLDSTAWGIAYPDLWRVFGGFAFKLFDATHDRGWALEQAWRRHMRAPEARLSSWRERMRQGELPAAILNATVVESGAPLPLTPLTLPASWGTAGPIGTHLGLDLPVTAAARMSATFPWVTPIARGPKDLEPPVGEAALLEWPGLQALAQQHLADGGYYDNFGVFSTVQWLRDLLAMRAETLRQRGVILVLIRASDPCAPVADPEKGAASRGWVYASFGPLITLDRVRTSTQLARNRVEVELLAQLLCARGVPVAVVEFPLRTAGPLSWKLTVEEEARIRGSWLHPDNAAEARRLAACYRDIGSCPPPQPRACPGDDSGPGA